MERIRAFDGFSHINASNYLKGYIGERPRIVRISFLRSVISYILCLKKPDMESAFAKMRQLSDDDRELEEFLLIGDIYKLLESRLRKIHLKDRSLLKNKVIEGIGDMLERFLGEGNYISELLFEGRSFRNVLDQIKSESFRIKCNCHFSGEGNDQPRTYYLGDDSNDDLWNTGMVQKEALDHDHLSQPYRGSHNDMGVLEIEMMINNKSDDSFETPPDQILKVDLTRFIKNTSCSLFEQVKFAYNRWKKVKENNFFVIYMGVKSKKRINRRWCGNIEMTVHLVSSCYTPEKKISFEPFDWDSDFESWAHVLRTNEVVHLEQPNDEDVNIDCDDFGNQFNPVYCAHIKNYIELDTPILDNPINQSQVNVHTDEPKELDESQIYGAESQKETFEDYENACVFICLRDFLGCTEEFIKKELERSSTRLMLKLDIDSGLTIDEIFELMRLFNLNVIMRNENKIISKINNDKFREIGLEITNGHCSLLSSNSMTSLQLSNSSSKDRSIGQNQIDISKAVEVFSFQRALKLNEQSRLGRFGVKGNGTSSNYGGFINQSTVNKFKKMKENEVQSVMKRNLSNTIVEVTMGFAGSGKSFGVEKHLERRVTGKFLVISPRNALKNSWCDKLKNQVRKGRVKVSTFESALQLNLSSFDQIILDEFTLYPPGYLSLLTLLFHEQNESTPAKKLFLILLFDPLQPSFFSDEFTMEESQDHIILLKDQKVDYLAYTRRLEKHLCRNFFSSIKSLNECKTVPNCRELFKSIQQIDKLQIYDVILCASRADKVFFSSYGKSMTFGEAQGLTFKRTLIIISSDALQVSPQHSIVAMTRAKEKCDFMLYGISDIQVTTSNKNFFFMPIGGIPVGASQLRNLFPSGCEVNFIETIGHRGMLEMEDKLAGDPFLKGDMDLVEPLNWFDEPMKEINVIEPKEKTHLTRIDGNYHSAVVTENLKERFKREIIDYPLFSEQFSDVRRRNEHGILGDSYRSESIYPRHQNSDSVTFWAAVKKRLVFSDPRKEKEKFMNNKSLGLTIFNLFKETFKLREESNNNLLEESINEFNDKKTSKPAGMITSHSNRSDTDWRLDDIFLFMKSQLCTKVEKRFCDGKAGQTLACFSHKVLVRFSPYCRYIEKVFSKQLEGRYYIHQRKDFNQLNEWVIKNGFDGICTESDYEAFDRSQDSIVMAFEFHLLKFFGWPDDLIDDYVWLKCNLGCKLGNFAIMRFTGEFCTFLFNTFCNMAFTAMRYHIGDASICFAGDDMCANRPLRKRTNYESILKRLTLKAKVQEVGNPTFCGWRLTKHGIFKQPNLVLDRLNIAKEKGNLKECIDGYSLEMSYAYDLGDRLFSILKEDELISHYSCVRLILENKSLLSPSIAELFEEKIGSRIGCRLSRMTHSKQHSAKESLQHHVYPSGIYMKGVYSTTEPSLRQDDLKPTCTSEVVTWLTGVMSAHLSYSTRKKLPTLKNMARNSNMCILEPLLLVSQACSRRMLVSKESLCFLTLGGKTESKHVSPEWSLILRTGGPRLCLYQILLCQYLMGISQMQSNFLQKSLGLTCMMEAPPFLLTLECCTASPMTANQTSRSKLRKVASIRASNIQRRWSLMRCQRLLTCHQPVHLSRLKQAAMARLSNRRKAGLEYKQGRLGSGRLRAQKQVDQMKHFLCPYIGQELEIVKDPDTVSLLRLDSTIEATQLGYMATAPPLSGKMKAKFSDSVKGQVMKRRRAFILNCLYNSHIRVGREAYLPDISNFTTWNQDQENLVNDVFEHFSRNVFGAFAAYGFSPLTSYPDEQISIPEMVITVAGAEQRLFGRVEAYHLHGISTQVKTAISASTNTTIRTSTWRNMGEAMAPEIYEFGKGHPNFGDFWGATKNALMVAPAPYLGTDVIEGVMLYLGNKATMDEKRVATRFQHWLTVSMNMRTRNIADSDTVLGN